MTANGGEMRWYGPAVGQAGNQTGAKKFAKLAD